MRNYGKVRLGGSILPARIQKVNWEFEYLGTKRYIPRIYLFSTGIVFDVLTVIETDRLLDFFEKYEAIEDSLTDREADIARGEHPYQGVSIFGISINGVEITDGFSSSSIMSLPWGQHQEEQDFVREIYPAILGETSSFALERFSVDYPRQKGVLQRLANLFRLTKIKTLKIKTACEQKAFPIDMHFQISKDEERKDIILIHPQTGIEHDIYFRKPEIIRLPVDIQGKNPFIMQAGFEINPALPSGDSLQFSSNLEYEVKGKINGEEYLPTVATSIGIIGGSNGPTAVFIGSKKEKVIPIGEHGLPLEICFSKPNFDENTEYHFHLSSLNIKTQEAREYLFK